ncbi:MAG: hypothetical protein M3362_02655 [Acidobacteriota bacterium]|nr:hypothetical protein [Acidobacteriota bacterium]
MFDLGLGPELKGTWLGDLTFLQRLLICFGGTILASIGIIFVKSGKRFGILPGKLLLRRDKRAPVLYLRSFDFDAFAAKDAIVDHHVITLYGRLPKMNLSTYEGVLAEILKKVGPCIAISDPDSNKKVLGFSRLEFADDVWQCEVQKLMPKAALVLICSGMTHWLQWELKQAAALVVPERLVILITPGTNEDWWQLAEEVFQKHLPRLQATPKDVFGGMITFDRQKNPRYDTFVYYQKDLVSIKNSLSDAFKPIFTRLHVPAD